MNDMAQAIIPRSDQWNYDDFLAGPLTFKITGVRVKGGQEQPVEIEMEGTSKFYRPCKSMSRCLVTAWGPDSSKYVGRSLTLYGDSKVKWGGLEVGGIRISHMSHIDSAMTMALTATKGSRKPFTVKPLVAATKPPPLPRPAPPSPESPNEAAGEVAGQPTMTFEQGMSLQELLEEKLIPTAKLLAAAESVTGDVYMSISQIPADFYERAVKWVEKQKSNRPNQEVQP